MEKLQSSQPWRKKINESSTMATPDYNDVFGVPPWHTAPFPLRLDDYSEIFDATASVSSIPVLDLSLVENGLETVEDSAGAGGCRASVDYFNIFGSFGGGGFAALYEELFAEPKRPGVSSSEGRTRWAVMSEQQEKEASEHPLKVYTENIEPLEKNQYLSFPTQSDDISSKQFSMSHPRMSRETFDNVVSDKTHGDKLDAIPGYSVAVDASDPVQVSKNKAVNKGSVVNTGTKGYTPDGGRKDDVPYFPSPAKNFAVNALESNCASLLDVPGDEKHNSQSYSSHSPSSANIPIHDVTYFKVSEISLQTKPFKGPPPSRPPPNLSMKPEHQKGLCADSRFDIEERSSLKSKVNNELHSKSETTKFHRIDEPMKGISFPHDTEMDPSSAAAVSMAAIKEAMEQAQVRLTSAKKLMDRKREKTQWKGGLPKTMSSKEDETSYTVEMKSRSKVIDATNLLKETNTFRECTVLEKEEIRTTMKVPFSHEVIKMQLSSYRKDQQQTSEENASKSSVECEEFKTAGKIPLSHERKMQLSSYKKDQQQVRKENSPKSSEVACNIVEIAGEWKSDKEYHELLSNDRLLNTVKGIYIIGDEEKAKASIRSCEKEKYSKDSTQAIEVEEKHNSMEASVYIEKLKECHNLKVPGINCMEEANKNFADATMDEFLIKDHASELEEDYDCFLSDENQKHSEAHEDNNNENNANKSNSVMDHCLYKETGTKLQNSNIDLKSRVANGYCEEKELKAAEGFSGYDDDDKRKFIVSHVKYEEVNESNEEVEVQNETLFHDILGKENKEPDELCSFNSTDKKEVDEEIKSCNNNENETRSLTHQYSSNANKCKVEERENAAETDEGDDIQTNDGAHILKNDLEQEAIQDENGLENGLEMPEAREKIKDAELEQILNSREGVCCEDCSEKKTRDTRTALQEDEESMGALMHKDVKNFELLAEANGFCGKRVSENITEVPVLLGNQINSNSTDDACQLGEIEDSGTKIVFLPRKEGSLLATAQDATEISHVDDEARNKKHFHTEVEENKSKMKVHIRDKEPGTSLEEKDLDRERERERIAVETANYEAHQQVLAEARVREERIAVERVTAEARQRALAEARQKAEKAAEAEKASREARSRAERAAVERATEEARRRAIEKALAEKANADRREHTAESSASIKDRLRKDNRTEDFRATHIKEDSDAKYKPNITKIQRNAQSQTAACSANDHIYSDSHINGGAESKLRSKARQVMQQHTAERATKSLLERNMRDILAQRELAERDRLAQSLDGEVRKWSSGKDGNLRALLSTLQYILGPDSGWQPIPVTDMMSASAAKKAYKKATLCVHPDKLQQRGAAIEQKYICEKVFDLLQEAWNKFNSEER